MPLWVKAAGLAAGLIGIGAMVDAGSLVLIGILILVFVALPALVFGRNRRRCGQVMGTVDQAMAARDNAIQHARIGGERFVQESRQREQIRGKQAVQQAKAATAALADKWVN